MQVCIGNVGKRRAGRNKSYSEHFNKKYPSFIRLKYLSVMVLPVPEEGEMDPGSIHAAYVHTFF